MPFGGLLTVGLMTAGGAIAGGLSNRSKTATGTSSTTTTLPPELQGLSDDLIGRIMQRLMNPDQGSIAGIRTGALDKVNKGYAGVPQRLTEQFAGRGFGSSGGLGHALVTTENSRAGDLAGIEQLIAQMVNQNEKDTMGLAANVLAAGRGQSTTSSQTQPGNVAAGALQGGVQGYLIGQNRNNLFGSNHNQSVAWRVR